MSNGERRPTTSVYKGVSWNTMNGMWISQIKAPGGAVLVLGRFRREQEREAALLYDKMAVKLHGKFARTNKMLGLLP